MWQGNFNSLNIYNLNDAVHFTDDGSSYLCVNALGCAASLSPAGNSDWGLVAEKGGTGPGEIGATGGLGPQGPQGEIGATGGLGPQGPQGEIGATGGLGPQGPQGEIGATGGLGPQGPAGPQGLVWQGNFNPLDIYVQNDAVHFTDGSSYLCVNAAGCVASLSPAGNSDWGLVAEKGGTGPQGEIGATGGLGPQGPQGEIGATGGLGPQGPQGKVRRVAWVRRGRKVRLVRRVAWVRRGRPGRRAWRGRVTLIRWTIYSPERRGAFFRMTAPAPSA